MRRNVLLAVLFAVLLIVTVRGTLELYRLSVHPPWCICDVCHEQFDNERGE